jgi:hypothetical protein
MEYSTTTRKVVIPRCETCNGCFKPKEKVFCIDCDRKLHYECAVYDDEDERYMLCIDCYKNKKIENRLYRDGIMVKVVGDDLCRAYVGKSFLLQDDKRTKIKIGEECKYELAVENEFNDNLCSYCGWGSEYLESHIEYGNWKCEYIKEKYDLKLDDEGDLVWEEKIIEAN